MVSPVSDLSVSIQQRAPVQIDAELRCASGELLALIGPSGSGKSTLLRMIAGLARPTSGRIQCGQTCWFDSQSGLHLPTQRRRVGYVPQHYVLFPHMSALHNVMAGLNHLLRQQREQQARDWLGRVHLAGLESRLPDEMSGGQQQRVAIARALARDPAVLLLDEPFSAVDRATRETLYLELAELKRELAVPTIMVTHDLNEGLLLADRITLLAHGRTLQSGEPQSVIARPASEAAARLVGIRNLFDGEVTGHDPANNITWLQAGDLRLSLPLDTRWQPGSRVRWMVPNNGVRLRAIARGDLPPGPNRVKVTIQTLLRIGNDTRIRAALPNLWEPLNLLVPTHLVDELRLQSGSTTDVVLREDSLQILSAADTPARPPGGAHLAERQPG